MEIKFTNYLYNEKEINFTIEHKTITGITGTGVDAVATGEITVGSITIPVKSNQKGPVFDANGTPCNSL